MERPNATLITCTFPQELRDALKGLQSLDDVALDGPQEISSLRLAKLCNALTWQQSSCWCKNKFELPPDWILSGHDTSLCLRTFSERFHTSERAFLKGLQRWLQQTHSTLRACRSLGQEGFVFFVSGTQGRPWQWRCLRAANNDPDSIVIRTDQIFPWWQLKSNFEPVTKYLWEARIWHFRSLKSSQICTSNTVVTVPLVSEISETYHILNYSTIFVLMQL